MGIMLNEDCCHFLSSRSNITETVDTDYLVSFIDQYARTCVSDFIMNISSTLSYVPSKIIQFAADKYLVKEEMGIPVDYTNDPVIRPAYHIWYEKGLDMYQIWIDRCRHNKINPWLSFRMNNAEYPYKNEPHSHLSEYYYEHYDDFARVQHRTRIHASDMCRDYGKEAFRKYMLAYIEEMLDRYDVFGIELDFLREHQCFAFGSEYEGTKTMTAFMQEVRKITAKAGEKYGHRIKILVRCPIEPRLAFDWGYDIVSWARLGLVDVVVPSPNWITTDNDAPLILWKTILDPYRVEVVGCIERNINCNPDYFSTLVSREFGFFLQQNTFETFCGSAAAILSQLPNNIYLFNYMDTTETDPMPKEVCRPAEEYAAIMNCASDLNKILQLPRKHIVSYIDTTLPWAKCNSVFPMTFGQEKTLQYIKINTGIIPKGKTCHLRLGMTSQKTEDVFCNSVKVNFLFAQQCNTPVLTDNTLYCFELPREALKDQYQVIEIYASETTIDYADIIVF